MKYLSILFMIILLLPIVSADSLIVRQANVIPNHGDVIVSMSVEKPFVGRTNMNYAAVMFDYDVRLRKTDHIVRNSITNKRFNLDMPNYMEDGCYMIRLTASNNEFRRVKHREICVRNGIIY